MPVSDAATPHFERLGDGTNLLVFELGSHCLAVRLEEVVRVDAVACPSKQATIDAYELCRRLGVPGVGVSHVIQLAGGGSLPATQAPRAAVVGVQLWSMPPHITRLGSALTAFAQAPDQPGAFVVSAAGLRLLPPLESSMPPAAAAPDGLEGFDEIE